MIKYISLLTKEKRSIEVKSQLAVEGDQEVEELHQTEASQVSHRHQERHCHRSEMYKLVMYLFTI